MTIYRHYPKEVPIDENFQFFFENFFCVIAYYGFHNSSFYAWKCIFLSVSRSREGFHALLLFFMLRCALPTCALL
jgi:hypothetical protein